MAVSAGGGEEKSSTSGDSNVGDEGTELQPPAPASRLVILVNLRSVITELAREASAVESMRAKLMAAWRASATAARERDRLAQEAHSSARRLDRAESRSSEAQKWQHEAETNTSARKRLNGMQTAYQSLHKSLKQEQEARANLAAEVAELRAELKKTSVQLRGLDSMKTRLDHAHVEVALNAQREAKSKEEMAGLRRRIKELEAELLSERNKLSEAM
eukprot:3064585-Pleurochrysis_carterae.AAC.1